MERHNVHDLLEWIERAGVDLASLSNDDQQPITGLQGPGQCGNLHASRIIGRDSDDTIVPKPKITQRGKDGGMSVVADAYVNWGVPNKPSPSAFHPTCRKTLLLAAARQTNVAIVAPVVKPIEQDAGNDSKSSSHSTTICSTTAFAGDPR